jgi:hypothetical protein
VSKNKFNPSKARASAPIVTPSKSPEPRVTLSFRHVVPGDKQCLSHCQKQDVRAAMECFRKLTEMTWTQLRATGTKDPKMKTGLNCTKYDYDSLKGVTRPQGVSPDLGLYGLRAGLAFRIYGVRMNYEFHVLWFDAVHGLCDG